MSEHDFPASFRVVAGRLGWGATNAAGKRLERMVLEREQETGRLLCLRKRGRRRTKRRITAAIVITEFGPGVKSSRAKLTEQHNSAAQEFREFITEIDENIRNRAREESEAAIAEIVQPQLTEIRAETLGVRQDLNELARRVSLSTAKPN